MSACAKQIFEGVTESVWDRIIAKLKSSYDIIVSSSDGTTSKDGFTVEWHFDVTTERLTVQCVQSPFFAPCGIINGKIHDFIEEARAAANSTPHVPLPELANTILRFHPPTPSAHTPPGRNVTAPPSKVVPPGAPSATAQVSRKPDPAARQCVATVSTHREATFEEMAALSPNAESMWPGALIEGASVESGSGNWKLVPVGRRTVRVHIPNVSGGRTVAASAEAVDAARLALLGNGFVPPATFAYEVKEFSSVDEAMIQIGARGSWMGAQAEVSLSRSDYSELRNFMISFIEQYYTISVDPETMALSPHAIAALPSGIDPDRNPLEYVSSVTYGRRALLFISSSESRADVEAAAHATASWAAGSAGADLDDKTKKTLKSSDTKLLVLGGNRDHAAKTIGASDIRAALPQLFSEAIGPEGVKFGVPISYRLSYMDHSVARLSMTGDFTSIARTALPTITNLRLMFYTHEHGKDDDTGVTATLTRANSSAIVAMWAQTQKTAYDANTPSGPYALTVGGNEVTMLASDIDNYALAIQMNPNGRNHWSFAFTLTGDLSTGDKYVRMYPSADLESNNKPSWAILNLTQQPGLVGC